MYNSLLIKRDGYQSISINDLQEEMDNQFGKNKVVVSVNNEENETFTISFIEEKKDYSITTKGIEDGINWNDIMNKAKAPKVQKEARNNGVIGIGTDGNTVNMDLWKYSKLEDGSFVLNDTASPSEANIFSYIN